MALLFSYLFLIETRFGPAISYDIRVEDRFRRLGLPARVHNFYI